MKLIGLMGEARTGKDSIADNVLKAHRYIKVPFAESLKNAAREIFGFSEEQLYGALKEVIDPFWQETPRAILQKLGTDAMRAIWPNVWIMSLKKRIDNLQDQGYNRFVVTDVRFKNELEAIKGWGGEVWRIYRIGGPGAQGGVKEHPSEIEMKSIPDKEFDAVIKADSGDLDTLYELAEVEYQCQEAVIETVDDIIDYFQTEITKSLGN